MFTGLFSIPSHTHQFRQYFHLDRIRSIEIGNIMSHASMLHRTPNNIFKLSVVKTMHMLHVRVV
jgi:hypothetical protein